MGTVKRWYIGRLAPVRVRLDRTVHVLNRGDVVEVDEDTAARLDTQADAVGANWSDTDPDEGTGKGKKKRKAEQ